MRLRVAVRLRSALGCGRPHPRVAAADGVRRAGSPGSRPGHRRSARRAARPPRARSRRPPSGVRGGAFPQGSARRRHPCRPAAPSVRHRWPRRRCAHPGPRRSRRWRRRPAARCACAGPRPVDVVPAQVRRVDHVAGGVDDTRRADADAEDRTGRRLDQLVGQLEHQVESVGAAAAIDGELAAVTTSPVRLTTAPSDGVVARGRGRRCEAASGAKPTSVGGLPTRLSTGAPRSSTRPSSTISPTRSETVTRVRRGRPGQVGPARRSVPEQLLEQQGTVVPPGVLLQQLAARPERFPEWCVHRHIS